MAHQLSLAFVFGTRSELIRLTPMALEAIGRGHEVCLFWTREQTSGMTMLLPSLALEADWMFEANWQAGETPPDLGPTLNQALTRHNPDYVLVEGYSVSACCGAETALNRGLSLAWLHPRRGALPERVKATSMDAHHFTVTEAGRQALVEQGLAPETVHVTGSPAVDMISRLKGALAGSRLTDELNRFNLMARGYLLMILPEDLHPGSSTKARDRAIMMQAALILSGSHPSLTMVLIDPLIDPMAPDCKVSTGDITLTGNTSGPLMMLPFLPYADLVTLMAGAKLVLTTSMSLQEQISNLHKPAVDLQSPLTMASDAICQTVGRLLTDRVSYQAAISSDSPFGDGQAASCLLNCLDDSASEAL